VLQNFSDEPYTREGEDEWCQTMFANIERGKVHRDVFYDVVKTGVMHIREDWFLPSVLQFLESLLAFQNRPHEMGSYVRCSQDNYKFLIYELFLYALAACIKPRRYEQGRLLLDHQYVAPYDAMDSQKLEPCDFTHFNSHPESLEGQCAERGNTRRFSVMADLIHDRATRKDIRFCDLLQADVLCCIASRTVNEFYGWFPRCLVHASKVGKLELFARATTTSGFEPLRILLGIPDGKALIRQICSEEMNVIWNSERHFRAVYASELFNLEILQQAWP